jgi:hypothetical protein
MRNARRACSGLALALTIALVGGGASGGIIDLNDFYADPTVIVAPDGTSAFFTEDPIFQVAILGNDPGLGDPEVILAEFGGIPQVLTFDYLFAEGAGEDDEFAAFLIDADTGFEVGAPYEFFTGSAGAGSVRWDLTGLQGYTLGMQFQLSSLFLDTGFTSTLEVSDLTLSAVPEPSTLLLLLAGGLAVFSWRASRRRRLASAAEG